MFEAGKFTNPHDQRYYDEEERMDKLDEIVSQNKGYFIEEMKEQLDDYLDYILEEAITISINYLNEHESKYIKDEIVKKINREYKLELKRR